MIRFERRAVIRNAALTPRAISFAAELNGYLNKKYDINLRFGLEMFGNAAMLWYMDVDDMAKLEEINMRIMQDKDYFKMLESTRDLWVDGSLRDRVVNIIQ